MDALHSTRIEPNSTYQPRTQTKWKKLSFIYCINRNKSKYFRLRLNDEVS